MSDSEFLRMTDAERGFDAHDDATVKAAVVVQRGLRTRWQVYRLFGPDLFVDAAGRHRQSGSIAFEGVPREASWIKINEATAPYRLSEFMTHYWQLPRPEVLISVTGGAQDFELPPQLANAFERGLAKACISAKAMIFTAGSDTGVMKLVANAKQRHSIESPLIGVFPWGVVNGREQLAKNCGGVCGYKGSAPSRDGAPLNPQHTHFICVDDSNRGGKAWGSEIGLRSSLESHISVAKSVPVVLLVVQGGPGTLATVLSAAYTAKPIVVLADSGGAATALHDYMTKGPDAVEERFRSQVCGVNFTLRLAFEDALVACPCRFVSSCFHLSC